MLVMYGSRSIIEAATLKREMRYIGEEGPLGKSHQETDFVDSAGRASRTEDTGGPATKAF